MDPRIFYNLYLNDNAGSPQPAITEITLSNGKTTGSYNKQNNYKS